MTRCAQSVLTRPHLYSAVGRDHRLVRRPRYACWPRNERGAGGEVPMHVKATRRSLAQWEI
jgi:hypothetical protein